MKANSHMIKIPHPKIINYDKNKLVKKKNGILHGKS